MNEYCSLCVCIQVRLTDTGGGERFRTLTAGYYRQANAVILVYSVDTVSSLSHLQEWIEDCINNNSDPDSLLWILVGNKADEPNEVPTSLVEGLCEQFGIRYFYYTSAKTGEGVDKMFQGVVKATHKAALKGQGGKAKPSSSSSGKDNEGRNSQQTTPTKLNIRKTEVNTGGKKCC